MHGMHYRAIDEQGRVHVGYMLASNHGDLERDIGERGWRLLPASYLQRIANFVGYKPPMPSWSKASASIFCTTLSQLIVAGVPILQALKELANLEPRQATRCALTDLATSVAGGRGLADAMKKYPTLFNTECIAAVRAGEASGQMGHCLAELGANLLWQSKLSEKLKTVLAYPVFALLCLVGVFLFVLLYLVPSMLPLLTQSESPLPVHTQVLLALSDLLLHAGAWLVVAPVLLVLMFSFICLYKLPLSGLFGRLFLRGLYGRTWLQFAMARYARSVSLLYESGVEITESMKISEAHIGISFLRDQLRSARERVLSGESIADAMRTQPSLPTLFVRMVAAGEYAGVVGVSLRQSADQLQGSAQYSLDRFERLIGPVLLCVMGAMLLWVALSVLGPIYSAVGHAGSF